MRAHTRHSWKTVAVPSPVEVILLFGLVALPLLALAGMAMWTRRIRRLGTLPRFASITANALLILSALLIAVDLFDAGEALIGGGHLSPARRARVLASGISESLSTSALAMLTAGVDAAWLIFCTWRWRRHPDPQR